MLNRLISLVNLLSFLDINIVHSETNFLLPQKKPSIFKKTQKEIQIDINKNLPIPKPRLDEKKEVKIEKKKEAEPLSKKVDEKKRKLVKFYLISYILKRNL